MNTRYPAWLVRAAREFAQRHRLRLTVVLAAALAEYLASREGTGSDPTPRLHHERGRPPAQVRARELALMQTDPRGRPLGERHLPARQESDEHFPARSEATRLQVADHA